MLEPFIIMTVLCVGVSFLIMLNQNNQLKDLTKRIEALEEKPADKNCFVGFGVEYEYQGKMYKFDDLPEEEQRKIKKLNESCSIGTTRSSPTNNKILAENYLNEHKKKFHKSFIRDIANEHNITYHQALSVVAGDIATNNPKLMFNDLVNIVKKDNIISIHLNNEEKLIYNTIMESNLSESEDKC